MSWILSRRSKKESIYTDGHGAYMPIMNDKNNCNDEE